MLSNTQKVNPPRTRPDGWKPAHTESASGTKSAPTAVVVEVTVPPLAQLPERDEVATDLRKLPAEVAADIPELRTEVAAQLPELHAEVTAAQVTIGKIMTSPITSVQVADKVVPEQLRELLDKELDVIANGPFKGYHPGTDGKVQTLIHPSLFPYVEGTSYVPDPDALPQEPKGITSRLWRREWEISKYQWLPTQFNVDKSGSVTVKSYINNLDLSHQELYRAIELSFSLFLPMFEKILETSLRSRELQVIVKAVNYVIQPHGETYKGKWHVEGMSHEHIVASGIYYYSTSPHLTDGGLAFREKGTFDEETELGDVQTMEGRLLAFSNGLQHQVSGIVNNSETEVGIRKILGFFLVDPKHEIVSTKHVPEQQWDRLRGPMMDALDTEVMKKIGRRMPTEILLKIMEFAKIGFTLEEACRHREALLEERRYSIDKANEANQANEANLSRTLRLLQLTD